MNKHSIFLLLSLVSITSSIKSAVMVVPGVAAAVIGAGAINDQFSRPASFFDSITKMIKGSAANGPISKGASTPVTTTPVTTTPVTTTPVTTTPVFEGRHIVTQEEANALQSSYVTSVLKAVKDNPALTAGIVAATVIVGVCVYNRKAIKKALFGKAASRKVVVA